MARHQGVRRQVYDRLCSVSAVVDRPSRHEEHLLRVEATPLGWWYTAPLPQGRLILTLMSDVDVLERHGALRPEGWRAMLATTRHLTRGLDGPPEVRRLQSAHRAWFSAYP